MDKSMNAILMLSSLLFDYLCACLCVYTILYCIYICLFIKSNRSISRMPLTHLCKYVRAHNIIDHHPIVYELSVQLEIKSWSAGWLMCYYQPIYLLCRFEIVSISIGWPEMSFAYDNEVYSGIEIWVCRWLELRKIMHLHCVHTYMCWNICENSDVTGCITRINSNGMVWLTLLILIIAAKQS